MNMERKSNVTNMQNNVYIGKVAICDLQTRIYTLIHYVYYIVNTDKYESACKGFPILILDDLNDREMATF